VAQGPHLVLLTCAVLLLAPACTDAQQDRNHALHQARFLPQRGHPCGPAAFLLKRSFGQIGGADLLPMPRRDFEVVYTGLGILGETAARFRQGGLLWLPEGLSAPLAFCLRGGISPIPPQRLARRPGLGRHLLPQVLPLREPPAHPQRTWPHTLHRFAEPRSPVRGQRDGGREPPFQAISSYR